MILSVLAAIPIAGAIAAGAAAQVDDGASRQAKFIALGVSLDHARGVADRARAV